MLALAPTGRAKGCGLQIAYAATEVLKQKSDLRSERSKSDSLTLVTDATSLHPVRSRFYCSVVPKKKAKLPLSKTHPELAKEADGWDTSQITQGSVKRLSWICKYGHSWEAAVYSRVRKKTNGDYSGCPYCSHKKLLIGFNDLKTKFPAIAKEADGWDPSRYVSGSISKQNWICKKGHKWKTTIISRTSVNQSDCPVCAGKKVHSGFNDFKSKFPAIASEADGWDTESLTAGSNKKMDWRCSNNHTWKATVLNRTQGLNGCPYCSNKKVLTGFNDLKSKFPDIAYEADGWNPEKHLFGSNIKMKWRCNFGHTWRAQIQSRTGNLKTGCPSCSVSGFHPDEDGYLYFLKHLKYEMFQIGITNYPKNRVAEHIRKGWEVIEIRGPINGEMAQQWETAILRMLKAKGADLSNSKIAGKFDGYSEAWSKSTFLVKSIKELMRLTEEFEEGK